MKKVFSFSLFGREEIGLLEKYWRGLYRNIELIHTHFPEWYIYVWVGDNVPEDIILKLSEEKNVKLLPTNQSGLVNMTYRFFSIDEPDVEVMCVRDADSRITERDRACVEDFLASDKLFHIIRDHPNHHHPVMGGMWGIKKGLLQAPLQDLFHHWKETHATCHFWNDMDFLKEVFYPHSLFYALIHDELQSLEPHSMHTPFRVPLDEQKQHFIGQVYEFNKDGTEYPKYPFVKAP